MQWSSLTNSLDTIQEDQNYEALLKCEEEEKVMKKIKESTKENKNWK
jgi:hypothetical protein